MTLTSTGAEPGRIAETVSARTARLVYGDGSSAAAELEVTSTVDLAHVVMLCEQRLLDPSRAASLLAEILRLRDLDFAPVTVRPTPRGLFLAYEQYLIEQLGLDVGGALHTARSRNDLKATATALRLRDQLCTICTELARLTALLLAQARRHRQVAMPIYTHFQAAVPATYGWYLCAVAEALLRDLRGAQEALDLLDRSPLGACGAAGTDLPIDCDRTARLLGFRLPPRHALDAVASRDVALRALGAAAGAALTVSRLAADLQVWSSAEFGLLTFPDRLVGGSSAMPQKRNAFLLEHLRAKSGAAIGAWTTVATDQRGVPFTNSIEIGTEAVAAVWPGLDAVLTGLRLAQAVVSGAEPAPVRMGERAERGYVGASFVANRLVAEGVVFRDAHARVGSAVREAVAAGRTRIELGGAEPMPALPELVASLRYGGGPGAAEVVWASVRAELVELAARRRRLEQRVRDGRAELDAAVHRLVGP